MSEYIPQICISASDPVNSVKSLQGSIIGILFEKKGKEIKSSIYDRLKSIDNKIKEYESVCGKTESFVEEKEKELKSLKEFHQTKEDEKKALLLPIKKEIEEKIKRANDITYEFDLSVFNATKEKAIEFEKGFDDIKNKFDEIDNLLIKDRAVIKGARGIQGSTGLMGETGIQGEPVHGIGYGSDGNIGIGTDNPDSILHMGTDPGDKAYSRLNTLNNLLKKYINKLESLKEGINRLKEEKRRLQLTYDNIDESRDYKLDLNMLSAFGFEK